jgi:hypothetical protein
MVTGPRIVLLVAAASFALTSLQGAEKSRNAVPRANEKRDPEADAMTRQEASFLRSVIYEEGVCTYTRTTDTPLPHREVSLKARVVELHKKKRTATIKLLLQIVRGGRPADARAAGVTALALEEGPVYPLPFADESLDSFDKVESDDKQTTREWFVGQLEKMLEKQEE